MTSGQDACDYQIVRAITQMGECGDEQTLKTNQKPDDGRF